MTDTNSTTRTWAMLCHISALATFVIPYGNILGPLIVWQIKKNELPGINPHGKEAVNFQLTIAILNLILSLLLVGSLGRRILWGTPSTVFLHGVGWASIINVINLVAIILAIIAGVRANNGDYYRYPFSIKFIK